MIGFERFAADFFALISDPTAWWTTLVGLAFGALCIAVGVCIGRRTRLLRPGARTVEELGVGLALGLVVAAAAYGTVRSAGTSVFAPSIALVIVAVLAGDGPMRMGVPGQRWMGPLSIAAIAVVVIGGMYGVTVSPSPRDGVQPVEFIDEAYYAVLGDWLRATGMEDVHLPAGFGRIEGLPVQSFYHWGELWLTGLLLEVPQVTPMTARHLAVLPLIVVATCAVTASVAAAGTRGARRSEVLVISAIAMLALAPIPFVLDQHFDWWARPIGFTVTSYGLAYVLVALGVRSMLSATRSTRPTRALIAALVAALVAAHVLVAALAALGVAMAIATMALIRPGAARRLLGALDVGVACVVGGSVAAAWGFLTGHGFAIGGSVEGIAPFASSWLRGMAFTVIGAGLLIVGPVFALRRRSEDPRLAAVIVGALAAVGAGALLWGLLIADFNTFHLYFGAVAVVLTPVAVIAIGRSIASARVTGSRVATGLIVLAVGQSAIGLAATAQRLYEYGPGNYADVPVAMLEAIRELPRDARLAYSCVNFEEVAIWDAALVSLVAHTGRPVVPMCFQSDPFASQLGVPADPARMNPFFRLAPQRSIYPTVKASPSATAIEAFLREHEIDYIWVDPRHPNDLVPGAREIARDGEFGIYRLP